MAIELKKKEEDQEDPSLAQPLLSSGQGATLTSSGAGEGGDEKPMAPVKDPIGQGVADVGKYLDANREKARDLATNIGGMVSGNITGAKDKLGTAQTQFQTDVDKGTVNFNEEIFGKGQAALTNPNATTVAQDKLAKQAFDKKIADESKPQATSGGGMIAGGLIAAEPPQVTAPTYNAGDADNFLANYGDTFKEQFNAQYGGPKNIQEQEYFREANKASQDALRDAGLRSTEQGRQELIARARQDSGRINRGVLALDQAIIAKDPEAMASLEAAAAGSPELEEKLAALKQLGVEMVDAARKTTDETRGKFRDEFSVSREVGEIEEAYKLLRDDLQKGLEAKKENVSGIAKAEGVDPMAFFSDAQQFGLNKYNVATTQDIERLKALEELTGIQSGFSPYADQAGQSDRFLDTDKSFDEAGFKEAVQQRLSQRMSIEEARKQAEKAAKEAKAQAQGQAIGSVVGIGIGSAIGGPIGGVVGGIIGGAIGGAICFDPETPISMYDGTVKAIKDIMLGDRTKLGGTVTSIACHLNPHGIFKYPTDHGYVFVTGLHAVFENNIWKRVRDSHKGIEIPISEKHVPVVYSISNENHRLVVDGQVFADDEEVNNGKLYSADESIEMLNYLERGVEAWL